MRQQLIFFQALFFLALLGLGAFGPNLSPAAEVSVEASLSHLSFPVDRAARLTVTVTGTSHNADIELPEIDNIQLHNQGSSSQISVINGSVSSSISHNYLVQALRPGAYTIPSIKVTAGGSSYSTEPLKFQVTPAGQLQSNSSGQSKQAEGELAFIRISETGSHYPGEIVPFTIKAYLTQAYRADINSLPTLHGDGVVMSQLENKPRQTEESVNGRMYHVLTWDTSLSGIKAGEHPINFTLDATLLIPQKRRSLSPFGGSSLFDDTFFNNSPIDSFFNTGQRKPIVAVSPKIVFKVLPLPSANQPNNFTGAIGEFDLKVAATPVNVEIGEPITLTMEISGTGNFDRVEAPVFPETQNWKTYSPTSNFSEQGKSYSGTKNFEQAIVAKSGAVKEIPSLSFSYFDPRENKYITKSSKAIAVNLKNSTAPPLTQPAQAVRQTQQQVAGKATPAANIMGLAPIHLETGSYHQNIKPLFKSLWMIVPGVFCFLVLLALTVFRVRQRNIEKHPEILLRNQKKMLLENDLKKVEQAWAAKDSLFFLSSCRKAIQNQLGLLWNIEPGALSLADIKGRLSEESQLIEIFTHAEEAVYGGATLTDKKMQDYLYTLKTELEHLL